MRVAQSIELTEIEINALPLLHGCVMPRVDCRQRAAPPIDRSAAGPGVADDVGHKLKRSPQIERARLDLCSYVNGTSGRPSSPVPSGARLWPAYPSAFGRRSRLCVPAYGLLAAVIAVPSAVLIAKLPASCTCGAWVSFCGSHRFSRLHNSYSDQKTFAFHSDSAARGINNPWPNLAVSRQFDSC